MATVETLMVESFEYYMAHTKAILCLGLIPFACIAAILQFSPSTHPIIATLLTILAVAATSYSFLALLVLLKTEQHDIAALIAASRKHFLPFVWICMLTASVTLGAALFFIVPSIYAAILLIFSACTLIDEEVPGFSALTQSRRAAKDHWKRIFGAITLFSVPLFIVVFAISTLIDMLFLLGFDLVSGLYASVIPELIEMLVICILIAPLGTIFMWKLYTMHKHLAREESAAEGEWTPRKVLVSLAWLGAIMWAALFIIGLFLLPVPFGGI